LANDCRAGSVGRELYEDTLGYKKVCVVDDSTDYGLGLPRRYARRWSGRRFSVQHLGEEGRQDFSAAVTQVKGAARTAVFYSGYYSRRHRSSAAQGRRLRRDFVSADGTIGSAIRHNQAVKRLKDAILSCPCGPAPRVRRRVQKKFNTMAHLQRRGLCLGTILVKGIVRAPSPAGAA